MGKLNQDLNESGPHSFIIKIWPEEKDSAGQWSTWRGQITHVPSGVQRYVDDLQGVTEFIKSSLKNIGITLSNG